MLVIPAIDIRHGQCVRLYQGQEDKETVYWKDPVEMASIWVERGAKYIHIADLDGAFQGRPGNLEKLERMKRNLTVPIQIGGGFRSIASIDAAFAAGADRVIIGTAAVYNPTLVVEALQKYGEAIAVSIDVAEDFVAVSGWKDISTVRFDELVRRMVALGLKTLLFTDTRKDGTLSGPNLGAIRLFLGEARGCSVIVSGGITTVEDVLALRDLQVQGLSGIVIGKALYDHRITLAEANHAAGV